MLLAAYYSRGLTKKTKGPLNIMQLTPEQVQSVNVLLSAVQVAQRRGAFSLQDAHTLQESLDKLVPREEQERQAAAARGDDDAPESPQLVPDDDDQTPAADSE